jgi:hypothetical protein
MQRIHPTEPLGPGHKLNGLLMSKTSVYGEVVPVMDFPLEMDRVEPPPELGDTTASNRPDVQAGRVGTVTDT